MLIEPQAGLSATAPGEARSPDAIAEAAEALGVRKAGCDTATLFVLAVLAGAFIGLGAMFATTVTAGAGELPYGVAKLLGGAVFSLGLVLVMVGGGQLFTGDALMVMAWASGRIRKRQMMRVWTVVWLGNLVGAVATAALVFASGQHGFGDGAIGEAAVKIAAAKSALPVGQAFVLGVLCNVLVCMAVWLALAGRSVTDKILGLSLPVTAFVAAGFEHSVANMYFVPVGLFIDWWAPAVAGPAVSAGGFALNLAAVSLGNWIGGAVLVGGAYWFAYRRPKACGPR